MPWIRRPTVLLFWVALALPLLLAASPAHSQADWTGWSQVSTLAVRNQATTALASGYTVQLVLDTATLVGQGLMRPDCADLRVSYVSGGGDVELDRLVEVGNTAATKITFRTQAVIGLAASDANYRLHYGRADAGSPPANLKNVYAVYDDFQSGAATGWTTKGNWAVVADGSNYVYRYTSGGANWALAYVPAAGLSDIDYVARVRATASTNWIGLAFRIQDPANFLTFYESKDVSLFKLADIVADNHTILPTSPLTMTANAWYRIRLQAIGNQVRSRMWLDGNAEPTSWMINTTDSRYQTASNIGATLYNHTTNADWDDFTVRRLVSTEPAVSVLANEYTLTLNTVGSGLVSKSPDLATYHYGDVVTLTATAADGWTFASWSDGLTGNPTAVTILGNTTVTASFAVNVAPWWDNAWGYRERLTVTNTSATDALGVGYSALLTVDAAALIATGRALNDCTDLRVIAFDGITNTELDRMIENAGTSQASVWFALPRAINPNGQDNGYYLYYGNAGSGAPPADGSRVFLFYEDWERGAAHWTNAGGLDVANTGTLGHSLISALESVSPGNSQQFPQKAGGGDAFSGYIPVSGSTGYAIGVWGKSATNAYVPVGLDPYDAGHARGTENWLWTNEWTVGSQWSQRSGRFVTPANAAYIKIKSEWWLEGPGTAPVYLDNLYLRQALSSDPAVAVGQEESTVPGPMISNISDTGPVNLGAPVAVLATVATTSGAIDAVTLRLLTPESRDVVMTLIAGDGGSGTWQAQLTPLQGGAYTYQILAHSTAGRFTLSAVRTFTVSDLAPPQITLVSVINPILVKNTQTLAVNVTDNGQIGAVTVTLGGTTYPMVAQGAKYSYSWRVTTVGTTAYTVRAMDTGGNQAILAGSFDVQTREVDVCSWLGGKAGAASWSIDDGNSNCLAELTSAGIRGTFYYNGAGSPSWLTAYSAAGHEIGSHSVGHPCDTPSCTPNCTPQALWQIPYTPAEVTAYRQDQLDPNVAGIEAATGKPVMSMAWPCGCADARRMTAAQPYFLGVRGYYDYIAQLTWVQGVNEPTPAEFMNLNSDNTYLQSDIDLAAAQGKWAIVTSHGDCSGISYIGSRQDVLWVAPVGEVLEYIKVRDASQFTDYSRVGRAISFDAAHNLATMTRQRVDLAALLPIAFDNVVTLKVHILDTDVVLGVTLDRVAASHTTRTIDGARYVTFDAALNTSRHVVVTLSKPTPVIDQVVDNSPIELGSPAQVTARVTVAEGTVQGVTLHVSAPVAADYSMAPVVGTPDTYAASFTPDRVGSHSYHVSAANDEGTTSQSAQRAFTVGDMTPPQWRSMAQDRSNLPVGQANTLSAEGLDLGGLRWAVLATDESGTWQEFNWGGSNWWNHLWTRRRAITIHETAGLARVNEMIDVPVSSLEFAGLANAAAELRVADANRQEVPCQVYGAQVNGGTLTCQLLFQADVSANAQRTYYIYYANPAAMPPVYSTDLTSSTAGSALTVRNTFLEIDLDTGGGVVSRVQLPLGSNTVLPLATPANAYWGWHQVCSSLDGNIAGKNPLCSGGPAQASGLVLTTPIDGPLVKVFELTSQKGAATYRMTYRYEAHAPFYQYDLVRTGTAASVINNFWYGNGNFPRVGIGFGGTPSTAYNTYDNASDHVRIASAAAADVASIDGADNDGTQLGGTDYRFPSSPGLSLCVVTASSQLGTEEVLARRAAPLTTALGAEEDAPQGQYGSPLDAGGATGWTPTAFTWQNGAIPAGRVIHWRVALCDVAGNCRSTDEMSFSVGSADVVAAVVPPGTVISSAHTCVDVPVSFTRTDATPARAYSVRVRLSPELAACDAKFVKGSYLTSVAPSTFQVIDNLDGTFDVDEAILGATCGATGSGTLFTVRVGSSTALGTGTITIENVLVRDCSNAPLPGSAGAAASVAIDNTGPAAPTALSAQQVTLGNDTDGTTKIAIAYTAAVEAGGHVEVWRRNFGNYPEYDDGATPGAVPAMPVGYPPSGWTQTAVTASGQADEPATRDAWYYVAYALDAAGNASASAMSAGALNYALGDVHNGSADCAGDNHVSTSDLTFFGAHYGASLGPADSLGCLDFGPTVTGYVDSRPTTDNWIDFEDLILFSINYGLVSQPSASSRPAVRASGGGNSLLVSVEGQPAVGGTFTATLAFSGVGDVQALSAKLEFDAAVVEPVSVERGALLSQQSGPAQVFTPRPGVVDVAVLGRGLGLVGTGELARVSFRRKAAGDPGIVLRAVKARDQGNRPVALDPRVAQPLPGRLELAPSYPNPFTHATTVVFGMPRAGAAQLLVFDIQGRAVRHLVDGAVGAGWQRVAWDGHDDAGNVVLPGAYVIRLSVDGRVISKSVRLVR